jgi:hypothetical protein
MRINMKLLLLLVAVLLVAASVAASLSVWRSTLLMPFLCRLGGASLCTYCVE